MAPEVRRLTTSVCLPRCMRFKISFTSQEQEAGRELEADGSEVVFALLGGGEEQEGEGRPPLQRACW